MYAHHEFLASIGTTIKYEFNKIDRVALGRRCVTHHILIH